MGFVDCDSHVIENDETWDHLRPGEENHRPLTVQRYGDHNHTGAGARLNKIWIVDDEWIIRFEGNGAQKGRGILYDPAATSLSDPGMRIEDLDVLGIDAQLIFSSLFLLIEGENPLTEIAVKRSYNRWVAEGAAGSGGRLRWVAELPTRTMAAALEELDWAAANGAGGVHLHGVEHGYYLDDPYFHPLYERCEALDLPMLVHVGFPQRDIANYRIGNSMPSPSVFVRHLAGVMTGFHAVLASDLHVRFPGLRWGFLEAGATWVASVLHQHARMMASASDYKPKVIPPEVLEEKGMFIACETDENLPELIRLVGENVLITGTDYSHNDLGTQLEGHQTILDRTDISPTAARKIVDDNGRRLLGIPADFTPGDAGRAAAGDRSLHIEAQELVVA